MLATPVRTGSERSSYFPRLAFEMDSSDGVALPRIVGIDSMCARITAQSRPW